ncbi:MAG: hypothetical protein A3I61_14100 [Acidobacteria bacterium RIFCSPLOWO2_02_FULL_68_18]|nr:MAG: hypothetical protein A3I61_14100 [Acidobacteria bacterium RIFCSPLOWO2_02_FULL_68_18]OFW50016.1 MAG: hypothetical protein A3G77_08850 [Acidobacteria bacterium RIFCSPLOWO2_12_FULL_68_19]
MTILVADDDPLVRRAVEAALAGRDVRLVADGDAAREALEAADGPLVAVLDWVMPGLTGPEVCRRVRAAPRPIVPYLILLTSRNRPEDLVEGFSAGADDYVFKPFDAAELRARVKVGERIVALHQALADRVGALETALAQVKQLQGLLPICAYCKRIRSGPDYWQQVESYIAEHTDATFTHGICPECFEQVVRQEGG